ncbi:MAG: phosphoribosylformylglycinamidine cyclo-ligase [Candidatus Marinimicrobia bacterium]|nr:phosphoribosylformylglycinamidine cyclo-ligase [Candidatus Neomarinimicrobiota bacterium]
MKKLKQSGININLGNSCSNIAYSWAKKTFINRSDGIGKPLTNLDGAFSNILNYNGTNIGISSDGIGTKIELAERTGIYNTIGFDLIAMIADDLIANGIEMVNFTNILDVDNLDENIINSLMEGLNKAANFSDVIITGGEIAELGDRINGFGNKMHFNWCGSGIGILPKGRSAIDGTKIKSGDVIISLRSRGFRSNGFSLIRKIMNDNFGNNWHERSYNENETWGEKLLTPSLIYTPLIKKILTKNLNIKGITHITGGGIIDNLARTLKVSDKGAEIDNIFTPLKVMRDIQKLGNVSEKQSYKLWNMGNGMLLIVDKTEVDDILKLISSENYEAKKCGEIINKNVISLQTNGNHPTKITNNNLEG